jgi:hypothetical protein
VVQAIDQLRPDGPVVQVLVEVADGPPPALALAGVTAEPVPVPVPSPVELTVRCTPAGDGSYLTAAYDADRFAPHRISALLATLAHVLAQAVASPDRAVGEFALRPDDQPVPDRDHAVLDRLGRRAAVGELGEIAARWAGGWHGTGRSGRYRPDGTVEPAPPPAAPVARMATRPARRPATAPST